MASKPNGIEDASDSDRADEEAAVIAAERVMSSAAEEMEDGTEALESSIGISAQAILEELGHKPAPPAQFEAVYGA
jgi:hypothetical protein